MIHKCVWLLHYLIFQHFSSKISKYELKSFWVHGEGVGGVDLQKITLGQWLFNCTPNRNNSPHHSLPLRQYVHFRKKLTGNCSASTPASHRLHSTTDTFVIQGKKEIYRTTAPNAIYIRKVASHLSTRSYQNRPGRIYLAISVDTLAKAGSHQ